MVSSGSPSARHSVPVEVHTAGSNRNVCVIGALWRAPAGFGVRCQEATAKRDAPCSRNASGREIRLRNFHYLIACPETGEALAVDPLEWRLCLEAARERGWQITQILNTHEHGDHTGGNAGLEGRDARTGAGARGRRGAHRRGRPWPHQGRRHQGRAHRGAGVPGHSRAHARARVPAGARARSRRCSAATRCSTPAPATATTAGDPQRALRHLRDAARAPAGRDAGVSRPRVPGAQSRVHARSRARQPGRGAPARAGARPRPGGGRP